MIERADCVVDPDCPRGIAFELPSYRWAVNPVTEADLSSLATIVMLPGRNRYADARRAIREARMGIATAQRFGSHRARRAACLLNVVCQLQRAERARRNARLAVRLRMPP
jgi:hypothetical protein